MASHPLVQLTSFNFWLGAIDAIYKTPITGPMVPASALIDNTDSSTIGAIFRFWGPFLVNLSLSPSRNTPLSTPERDKQPTSHACGISFRGLLEPQKVIYYKNWVFPSQCQTMQKTTYFLSS